MPKCYFRVVAKNYFITSKTWIQTLYTDPEKPGPTKRRHGKSGPKKTWTLKNMNPGKYGVNVGGIKTYV